MLVAAVGVALQRVQHDLVEAHVYPHFFRRRGEAAHRDFAGEHFVKDHAERIDVRAVVHGLRLVELLGGHVARRAERHAGYRERVVGLLAAQEFREAEVGDLHTAAFINEDVLRLHVAVDDALLVRELQRVANLRHDGERLLGLHLPGADHLAQVYAVHEFHREIIQPAALAEVVDGDDVRVAELRERARLASEALDEIRRQRVGGRQDFQRDDAIQIELPRLVHDAHAAAPEQLEDFKLRQPSRDLGGVAEVGDVRQ